MSDIAGETNKGPEDYGHASRVSEEDDVEGHRRDPEAGPDSYGHASRDAAASPEGYGHASREGIDPSDEDDVEGHRYMRSPASSGE